MSKTIDLNIVSDSFIQFNQKGCIDDRPIQIGYEDDGGYVVVGRGIKVDVPVNLRKQDFLSIEGSLIVLGDMLPPENLYVLQANGLTKVHGDLTEPKTTFYAEMDAIVMVHGQLEAVRPDYLDNMEGNAVVSGVMVVALTRLRTVEETDLLPSSQLDSMTLDDIEHITII